MTGPGDQMPEVPRPGSGSLLDGLHDGPAAARGGRGSQRGPKRGWFEGTGAWLGAVWAHPASRVMVGASALMVCASGAIGAWVMLRPVPQPDYQEGGLDTLFNYTLLTDEFNRLPVQERLDLIGQLVGRVRDMDASDSVLMAAFAAQIDGPAREQLVENASRVMVDLMDESAEAYDPGATRQEREQFLEQSVLGLLRARNTMLGAGSDTPDDELLDDARQQAQRDAQYFREGNVSADQIGQISGFLTATMGEHTSAAQKLRLGRLGRDMARYLRGEDIDTGRPLPRTDDAPAP